MASDSKQAGEVDRKEIEITPEIIEAGAEIIWSRFDDVLAYGSETGRELATEVFQAMWRAYSRSRERPARSDAKRLKSRAII